MKPVLTYIAVVLTVLAVILSVRPLVKDYQDYQRWRDDSNPVVQAYRASLTSFHKTAEDREELAARVLDELRSTSDPQSRKRFESILRRIEADRTQAEKDFKAMQERTRKILNGRLPDEK